MSRKTRLFIATLPMVFTGLVCLAQVEQGAITGAVTDASGASLLKARVTAANQATGVGATAETTDDGYYKIPYLLAGKYIVTVEMSGFSTYKVTDVPVLVGQNATINVTMKPGSLHDEVTVVANSVMVDQVSSSLGYVTGTTQILELPIGRSTYSLINLSPGVIATGNTGTGPIVNGGRSNTSAILFDGQDTQQLHAGQRLYPAAGGSAGGPLHYQ
jgi:hypothetical protein